MTKTVSRRVAWESPNSWRLEVETVRRPDGRTEEKGYVRHPGAVVLVPMRSPTEVIMLRQFRQALGDVILELPAGTRDWGEAWLSCAQRELREETGFRAEKFTDLGQIWPAPGLSDEVLQLYLAEGLSADPLPPDFDEQIEIAPMPLAEVADLALSGRLQDAKSNVAILRAQRFLSR